MNNKTMNGFTSTQDLLKRRWDDKDGGGGGLYLQGSSTSFYPRLGGTGGGGNGGATTAMLPPPTPPAKRKLLGFSPLDEELASSVVPPVTVVLEGRSICHRIHLHKHTSYGSLAAALHRMFVDSEGGDGGEGDDTNGGGNGLDLAHAVPGYMVAYEDIEDDLLLAGDLSWKDFVRVAKRIRLLPAKPNRRKQNGGLQV